MLVAEWHSVCGLASLSTPVRGLESWLALRLEALWLGLETGPLIHNRLTSNARTTTHTRVGLSTCQLDVEHKRIWHRGIDRRTA